MPATSKVCTACGELKSLDDFDKNPQGALGRQSRCKVCRRKASTPKAAKPAQPKVEKAAASNGHISFADAAAQVLADAGQPMRVPEIAAAVLSKKLWRGESKNPAQTLSGAIQRELKGKSSRFARAGRGMFTGVSK